MIIKKIYFLWLFESIVWIFTLVMLVSFLFWGHAVVVKNKNTYHVFMHDIDGIVVGSPVRLSGVQIGYVNGLKMIDDEIYVSFLITKKKLALAKGSHIAVEFAGIAGSKSLEVYPPETTTGLKENLVIEPTHRLGEVFQTFKKYSAMMANMQEMMAKLREKDIEVIQNKILNANLKPVEDTLNNIDGFQKKYQKKMDNFSKNTQKIIDTPTQNVETDGITIKMQKAKNKIDEMNEAVEKINSRNN